MKPESPTQVAALEITSLKYFLLEMFECNHTFSLCACKESSQPNLTWFVNIVISSRLNCWCLLAL